MPGQLATRPHSPPPTRAGQSPWRSLTTLAPQALQQGPCLLSLCTPLQVMPVVVSGLSPWGRAWSSRGVGCSKGAYSKRKQSEEPDWRKRLAGVWPWQMEPSGAKHHKGSFLGNLPIFCHTTYTALWLRARLWVAWEGLGASPTHTLIHTRTAPLTQSVLIPSLPDCLEAPGARKARKTTPEWPHSSRGD